MFMPDELRAKGFIPKKNYKIGQTFPEGFTLPKFCTHREFLEIPLYIKVWYDKSDVNGGLYIRTGKHNHETN